MNPTTEHAEHTDAAARAERLSSAWPLEDGEHVLWEGAPDAALTDADRRQCRRGVVAAVLAAAIFVALLAWRLSFGDEIAIHPADSTLGDIAFDATPVDGMLALYLLLVPLHLLLFFWPALERRMLRGTRYALTDRRLLLRRGRRIRQVVPVSDISAVGFGEPDALSRAKARILRRSPPPWHADRNGYHPLIGPFSPAAADALDAALRKVLGLSPAEEKGDAPSGPGTSAPAFPAWMEARERERTSSILVPGETLLWCGRPAACLSRSSLLLAACIGIFFICAAPVFFRPEGNPLWIPRIVETERMLLMRVGGVAGWTAGAVFALFELVIFAFTLGGVAFLVSMPWWERRSRLRSRYLVTDRRVLWLGKGVFAPTPYRESLVDPAGELDPPVVRRSGPGRSDLFLRILPWRSGAPARVSRRTAIGLLDLPDEDIPAALAALERLRRERNARLLRPPATRYRLPAP